MLSFHSSSTRLVLGFIGLSLVGYQVAKATRRHARNRQKEQSLGCGKAKARASRVPFFNLDIFLQFLQELRQHVLLDSTKRRFEEHQNWTMKFKIWFQTVYFTAEPENVKAVLSLNFRSYGIGEEREALVGSLLGKGIFTSDGEAWRHSRNMLRPSFVKSELADLKVFEPHVQALIQNIKTKTTIDLQPLFNVFTFDVATEFLLGQSTACLTMGDKAAAGLAFMEAFDRCRSLLSGEGRLGIINFYLPNWQYRRDIKTIQGMPDIAHFQL